MWKVRRGKIAAVLLMLGFLTGGLTAIVGIVLLYDVFRKTLQVKDLRHYELGSAAVIASLVLFQFTLLGLFDVLSLTRGEALNRYIAVVVLLYAMFAGGHLLMKRAYERFTDYTGFPAFKNAARFAALGALTFPVVVGSFLLFVAGVILFMGFERWGMYVEITGQERFVPACDWANGGRAC